MLRPAQDVPRPDDTVSQLWVLAGERVGQGHMDIPGLKPRAQEAARSFIQRQCYKYHSCCVHTYMT